MFSFLSSSMATASQRFFAYELGRNDHDKLQKTFSMSVSIYLLIAVIVLVIAETAGLYFVKHTLIIPEGRSRAVFYVYQFSIISFLVTILTTPYLSAIIARENMSIYAYVSIIEAVLKLSVVFLLQCFPFDKLILYSALLLVVTGLTSSMYVLVCKKKYNECHYNLYWDLSLFRTLFSYVGWNLFGSGVSVVKNQVTNILLNLYFGPVVNAARGIASQVSSAAMSFSQSFSTAVRPQIIKLYASDAREQMMRLVSRSCKMTAYLMFLLVLPLFLEMPSVIQLWLGQVPEYVVLFTRLVLVDVLIDSISYPLMAAAQATGKIKLYQSLVGGVLLLNLPVSYLFLQFGARPESVMYIAITITLIAFFIRVMILKSLLDFSIKCFFKDTVIPVLLVFVISGLAPTFVSFLQCTENTLLNLLIVFLLSFASLLCTVFAIGISKEERIICKSVVKHVIGRKWIKS